jgi:hypothetical protein
LLPRQEFWLMYHRWAAQNLQKKLAEEQSKINPSDHIWKRLKWGHFYRHREMVFWKEQAKQQDVFTDAMVSEILRVAEKKWIQGDTMISTKDELVWINFSFSRALKPDSGKSGDNQLTPLVEQPPVPQKKQQKNRIVVTIEQQQ